MQAISTVYMLSHQHSWRQLLRSAALSCSSHDFAIAPDHVENKQVVCLYLVLAFAKQEPSIETGAVISIGEDLLAAGLKSDKEIDCHSLATMNDLQEPVGISVRAWRTLAS